MLDRIATLTWRRPKLVLALVAVFTVVAGGVGYDVEHHLKAAGFTDPASQSERATELLRDELGYDASPAIAVLVRAPGGGRLDVARRRRSAARWIASPASWRPRATSGTSSTRCATAARARELLARDGGSLVITAGLSTQDIESDGGEAAEEAQRRDRRRARSTCASAGSP